MNKAVALASAPVISFLNADDTYVPGTLRRVLGLLPGLPEPGFLVGNCNVWDERGNLVWVNRPARLGLDDLLVGSHNMQTPMNPSAYFYHRSLHDLVGPYDLDDAYAMDLDFLLRALPAAHTRYVDEAWGNFNMLPGAKTFEDAADGRCSRRVDLILQRERAKLPPLRRLTVQVRRILYKIAKIPSLLVYYSRNAGRILPRLKYFLRPSSALAQPAKASAPSEAAGE